MLFLKYLWDETLLRYFIPALIVMIIWFPFTLGWGWSAPWVTITIFLLAVGIVTFFLSLFIHWMCDALKESLWDKGYKIWKSKLDLPPNSTQLERAKIEKIMDRYILEQEIRVSNATAKQLYSEYQMALALVEGVEIAEDIEIYKFMYGHCLKDDKDL